MKLSPAPPAGYLYIEDSLDAHGNVVAGIATRLGISPSTYRKWRMRREGPKATRYGKRVIAREADVETWIEQQVEAAFAEQQAENEAAEHAMRPAEPRTQRRRTPKAA